MLKEGIRQGIYSFYRRIKDTTNQNCSILVHTPFCSTGVVGASKPPTQAQPDPHLCQVPICLTPTYAILWPENDSRLTDRLGGCTMSVRLYS